MVSAVARARVTEAVVVRAVMLGYVVSRNIVSLGWWCGVLSCGVGGCRVYNRIQPHKDVPLIDVPVNIWIIVN